MRTLLLAVVLLLVAACGADVPAGVDARAQAAWEAWQDDPGPPTLIRLIEANRKAALRHGVPDDALGVLYQVRGTEALAARSETEGDLEAASSIDLRVTDLEEGGVLAVYEEVLPGSQARLLAARRRMRALLGRE